MQERVVLKMGAFLIHSVGVGFGRSVVWAGVAWRSVARAERASGRAWLGRVWFGRACFGRSVVRAECGSGRAHFGFTRVKHGWGEYVSI